MNIQFKYNSINVNISIKEHVGFIVGNSGTGKTFLFELLCKYCDARSIAYYMFNHSSYRALANFDVNSVDLIVLDNAELYLNEKIYNLLKAGSATVLICCKNYWNYDMCGVGLYEVEYTEHNITTKLVN